MTNPRQSASPPLEEEVWRGKPSLYGYFGAWIGGLLLLPVGIGLLILLRAILHRVGTNYLLTTVRATVQTGILFTSSQEIRLADIRSINMRKRGITGLLGIGSLELSSAARDRAEVYFAGVDHAEDVRDLVRFGQGGGDMRAESSRLLSVAANRGEGFLGRFVAVSIIVGVTLVSGLISFALWSAILHPRTAQELPAPKGQVTRPRPPSEPTPRPEVTRPAVNAPAVAPSLPPSRPPSPSFAEQVAASQRRAAAKYPDLARAGSVLNASFVARVKLLQIEKSPRLQQPDWPERVADEIARIPVSTAAVAPGPVPTATTGTPPVNPRIYLGISEAALKRSLGQPVSVTDSQSPDGPFRMLVFDKTPGKETFFTIFAADGVTSSGYYRGAPITTP